LKKAEAYAKTNVELLKLKTIDKSADIFSSLAMRLATVVVIILVTLMVNIGLALWIGELIGKSYIGFFIVTIFYLLIAVILHFFGNRLIKAPINDSIITQMLMKKSG